MFTRELHKIMTLSRTTDAEIMCQYFNGIETHLARKIPVTQNTLK